jgi:hypothetical protein
MYFTPIQRVGRHSVPLSEVYPPHQYAGRPSYEEALREWFRDLTNQTARRSERDKRGQQHIPLAARTPASETVHGHDDGRRNATPDHDINKRHHKAPELKVFREWMI